MHNTFCIQLKEHIRHNMSIISVYDHMKSKQNKYFV